MSNSLSPSSAATPASGSSSRQPSFERSRASTPATSAPSNAAVDKTPEDPGRLRTFIGILKKFIGVADITAVRFSLPAQLLEPVPNLEYWNYLDRPETFASIGDSDEPIGRILGALRFWFTKDLKYVKGKPCKPYNSVLGEFFRCNWEVEELLPPLVGNQNDEVKSGDITTVTFLCEQTSHHPPISAYCYDCPQRGISARGYDSLSASFTGTRIKVGPGHLNEGIFIKLDKYNEEYQLTHPTANLGGFFRGSLNVTVADHCYVTCPQTKLKVILHYVEEGWLGRTQNKVVGIIFKYDPKNDDTKKLKDVPESEVLGRIEGCWHEKVYFSPGNTPFDKSDNKKLMIDLEPLWPAPKFVPPDEAQLENESRLFWSALTDAIVNKRWNEAGNEKHRIEEQQRTKATERKAEQKEWRPRFFKGVVSPAGKSEAPSGRPVITEEGKAALKGMQEGQYELQPSDYLPA